MDPPRRWNEEHEFTASDVGSFQNFGAEIDIYNGNALAGSEGIGDFHYIFDVNALLMTNN